MTQIWALRYRQSGSDRLEKQPIDLRQNTCYFGDGALESHCSVDLDAASTKELDRLFDARISDQLSGKS